jgi:molybdenum cofactor biosynthesis protein A
MPESGIQYLPKKELLTFEEIVRLLTITASLGISKIRLTGGEPFVRNDLMKLMHSIVEIPGIRDLHITTNGILTAPYIADLKKLGIASVNLSLDSLDAERFKIITRRDEFTNTLKTLNLLLENAIPVKINAVIMEGKNIDDIIPMVELTRKENLSVRFIEEMPFNGSIHEQKPLLWTYKKILTHIQSHYPDIFKVADPAHSTSYNYQVPGYAGNIGIIAAFSRTFCGTCNRIRLTAQGIVKTCLYDEGVMDIKKLLRSAVSDEFIKQKLMAAFQQRYANGFDAELNRKSHKNVHESMSTIGG